MNQPSSEPFERIAQYQTDGYLLALRILSDPQSAEDAVQESMLRIVRLSKSVPEQAPRQWFLRLVAASAKNIRRTARRRIERERTAGRAMERTSPPPSAQKHEGSLKAAVAAALAALDEPLRVPVSLRYEQGLSHAEAAEILEVPEPTLRKNVSRGIERLREMLARQGFAVAPNLIAATLSEGFGVQPPASLSAALEHIRTTGHRPPGSAARPSGSAPRVLPAKPAGLSAAFVVAGAVVISGSAWMLVNSGGTQTSAPQGLPLDSKPDFPGSLTVSNLRVRTLKVLEKIVIPANLPAAKGFAHEEGILWLAHGSTKLSKLDGLTGKHLGSLEMKMNGLSGTLATDENSRLVLRAIDGKFHRIDVATGEVALNSEGTGFLLSRDNTAPYPVKSGKFGDRNIKVPAEFDSLGEANEGNFWCSFGASKNTLYRFDPLNGMLLERIEFGRNSRIDLVGPGRRAGCDAVWVLVNARELWLVDVGPP